MNETLQRLSDAPQPPTYLHIENAQLKQQLAQMQAAIQQRSVQVLSDFVNGLNAILAQAQAGDPNAQMIAKAIRDCFEQLEQQASPLTVVRAR